MKKQARKPAGAVSGKFVTKMFSYEGGRQVTVYIPPDPPEAIVFAGDGQRISKWGRYGLFGKYRQGRKPPVTSRAVRPAAMAVAWTLACLD